MVDLINDFEINTQSAVEQNSNFDYKTDPRIMI